MDRRVRRPMQNAPAYRVMEKTMTNSSVYTYALAAILSLSVAGAASQSFAKTGSKVAREAAIHKCVAQAVSAFPPGPESNDSARAALYKSCMTDAGFAP